MCYYSVVRAEVKEFYKYICQFCYNEFHPKQLQVHHILRRSDGGSNNHNNLLPLCGGINTNNCHCKVHKYNIQFNNKGKRILYIQSKETVNI